jgi:hypothetical protein
MNQLELFTETVGLGGHRFTVRLTDPETSQIAGQDRPSRDTDRDRALEALKAAGATGLTDYELGYKINRQQNSAGKRRGELVRMGLAEYAGFTRPGPSGSPCRVWRAS